ncbi:hypothetical protein RLW55_16940 [Hyphomicrobium sp. B1]|uniref:hypothetical protein n=1 Tax=Hyphomicrobium sp. B1 TaxID=3075651 RepID=UPI003C2B9585
MPRSRTPIEKARVTGQAQRRKTKFASRREIGSTDPLGDPPKWMTPAQQSAWRVTSAECPWLNRSHRCIIEIAAVIRGDLISGTDVGVNRLNVLRQILGQLGATPADASKISVPSDHEDDPGDKYFN